MAQAADGLQAIIEAAVSALGYELVGVEYLSQGRHSLLRVYIDSEDGISVEDCGKASHQISSMLEVEDPIKGQYTLEVSSPGVERPLFTAEHFEAFAGHQVQLRLRMPLEGGRHRLKGLLLGMRNGDVIVEVDDEEFSLPLANIERARLVAEW